MVEKHVTVEFVSESLDNIRYDTIRLVHRIKGIEGIQKLDPDNLNSVGYKFGLAYDIAHRWIYQMFCSRNLKYEDLDEMQREVLKEYFEEFDVKASKHIFPFMKEIRKKKIMAVLLCMRKSYPLIPKEIVWMILDFAYSPINERGSF